MAYIQAVFFTLVLAIIITISYFAVPAFIAILLFLVPIGTILLIFFVTLDYFKNDKD